MVIYAAIPKLERKKQVLHILSKQHGTIREINLLLGTSFTQTAILLDNLEKKKQIHSLWKKKSASYSGNKPVHFEKIYFIRHRRVNKKRIKSVPRPNRATLIHANTTLNYLPLSGRQSPRGKEHE